MDIIDDGNGFDNTKVQIGNGLQNMQHRCDALKGKLLISSTVNKGTSIHVSFKIA
jgi:signal transduction histidine kinase